MIRFRLARSAGGFTFVELLVAVVIIGVLSAIAIPFFMKATRRTKLVGAAHEIQSSLMAARMRAVRANVRTSLVLTAASGGQGHRLDTVSPDNSPLPTPTPLSKETLAPDAFSFVTTPTNSKVTFSGDGRMISETVPTPAVIKVQGPPGSPPNQVTIRTNSAGKVEVVTPVAWQ